MSAYQLEFKYEGVSNRRHLFVGTTGMTPLNFSESGREVVEWCRTHLGPGWKYVVLREGREEVQFARAAGQYKQSPAVGAFLGTKHFPYSRPGISESLHVMMFAETDAASFKLRWCDHKNPI